MELEEIVSDLSIGGKFEKHYEELMRIISYKYSDDAIERMRESVIFFKEDRKSELDVERMGVLEVLYEYSKLL